MRGTSHFWSWSRRKKKFGPGSGGEKFYISAPVSVKNILFTVPVLSRKKFGAGPSQKKCWSGLGPGQKKKFGPDPGGNGTGNTLPISSD